jgi:hypothetical protein
MTDLEVNSPRRTKEANREVASLSAVLAAAGMTLLGLAVGASVLLERAPLMLLWAPLGAIAAAWAIPGSRWWWSVGRVAGSVGAFSWIISVLFGQYGPEFPVGALVSLGLLLALVVILAVATRKWWRSSRISLASWVLLALCTVGAGASIGAAHASRTGMVAATIAEELAIEEESRQNHIVMIHSIRENPEPWLEEVRLAIADSDSAGAQWRLMSALEALGRHDQRLSRLQGELALLETKKREGWPEEPCQKPEQPPDALKQRVWPQRWLW